MDAQHAGKENFYKLEKGGVKYTLLPLKVTRRSKDSKLEKRSFLTITNSEREMGESIRESRVVHAWIVKDVVEVAEECNSEVPKCVKEVLEEFKEVLPDDLPEGLPL